MKYWKCPCCPRESFYDYEEKQKIIMKVCCSCGSEMEVVEDETKPTKRGK